MTARKAPRNWGHFDGGDDHEEDDDHDQNDENDVGDREEQNYKDGEHESDDKNVLVIDFGNVGVVHHGVHDEVYHWVPHYRRLGKLEW